MRLASLWRDGGLSAARVAEQRAELSQWRASCDKWARSHALRRQLLLEEEERKAAAKTIIDAANGSVPIFLSVQESHLADTIELAKYAEAIGYCAPAGIAPKTTHSVPSRDLSALCPLHPLSVVSDP